MGIGVGVGLVANDLRKGEYGEAGLDALEAIPVVGDVVGAGHLGVSVGTTINNALGIEDVAAEHSAMVERAAKWAGLGQDSSRIVGASGAALGSITVAPTIALYRKVAGWFD